MKVELPWYVYFEAMLRQSVHMVLKYLKENNPFYGDICIDVNTNALVRLLQECCQKVLLKQSSHLFENTKHAVLRTQSKVH